MQNDLLTTFGLNHLRRAISIREKIDRFQRELRLIAGSLPSAHGPRTADRLVIFVDEIDIVRSLPFSTDEFFAAT